MVAARRRSVVVTGAGGFLGSNLLSRLLDSGLYSVVAVTSKEFGGPTNCKLRTVSSADLEGISAAISSADILVNCAFPRVMRGSHTAYGLRFIERLFSFAESNGDCSVINISSQSVYDQGNSRVAVESDAPILESSYSVAKYATELLLDAHCSHNQHTNIRLASLVGAGFDQRVVNKMINKAMRGETLVVKENGSKFGYLDVRDAADALVKLCNSSGEKMWDSVYNVGSNISFSLTDIAKSVASICNGMQNPSQEVSIIIEEADCPPVFSLIDSTLFSRLTGWKPRYKLEDTVSWIAGNIALS